MNETPDDLLPEYDFDYSQAQPNRFAGRGAVAVTLRADVLAYLEARATAKGLPLGEMVNDMLKIRYRIDRGRGPVERLNVVVPRFGRRASPPWPLRQHPGALKTLSDETPRGDGGMLAQVIPLQRQIGQSGFRPAYLSPPASAVWHPRG